jgi:hypothetical protein
MMEVKNLKATLKEIKQHTCGVELQGLPNPIKKKNDEKLEKQLKHA